MKSENLFMAGSYFMFFAALYFIIFGFGNAPNEIEKTTELENAFALSYLLLLLFVGFLNIRLVKSGIPSTVLRITYWWNFIMFGAILVVMIYFQIIPAIIVHSIISLCFLLTLLGKDEYLNQ